MVSEADIEKMKDCLALHYLKMGFTTQAKVDHLRGALAGKHNYRGWGYKKNRKEMCDFKVKSKMSHEDIEDLIGRMRRIYLQKIEERRSGAK